MVDKSTIIRGLDHRKLIIDSDDEGVCVSMHIPGGHMLCTIPYNEAIELINALRCIVGDDNE